MQRTNRADAGKKPDTSASSQNYDLCNTVPDGKVVESSEDLSCEKPSFELDNTPIGLPKALTSKTVLVSETDRGFASNKADICTIWKRIALRDPRGAHRAKVGVVRSTPRTRPHMEEYILWGTGWRAAKCELAAAYADVTIVKAPYTPGLSSRTPRMLGVRPDGKVST